MKLKNNNVRRIPFTDDELNDIYDKTDGRCAICDKKLSWKNYGNHGGKGSWEVDHGMPLSRGGTDTFRNCQPLCIKCNREKGDLTTNEFKRWKSFL